MNLRLDKFRRAAELNKKLWRGELTYQEHQNAMQELLEE